MGEVFRLNEPEVACEALEGDLILLHFGSGLYYNLRGTGADICQHLINGGRLATAIGGLAGQFNLPMERIEGEVRTFVEQLEKEGLLVAIDAAAEGCAMQVSAKTYEPPRCEKFDDMADQLLLDKIDDQAQDAQWAVPPAI